METRPTTDRIKETLFNMLQNRLYGCTFLDLFAGSGAIGIEALSRGAKRAVFIESGRRPVACIRENLKTTRLEDRAQVLACEVSAGLKRLSEEGTAFDFRTLKPEALESLLSDGLNASARRLGTINTVSLL